jgi:hypothetical protein
MIISNPERVCLEHALEFWTGLLVHARDGSDPSCEELSASDRRAIAIAGAGPSPRSQEAFPIRLAS